MNIQTRNLSIVAAVNNKGYIGKEHGIPWHDKEDLDRFFNLVVDKDVIVGFKTFDHLPPKVRRKLVLTTKKFIICSLKKPGSYTFKEAINIAPSAFIIGGGQIYKAAIDSGLVKYWYITTIDDDSIGDVKFPTKCFQ